jgi:hypothetical protein
MAYLTVAEQDARMRRSFPAFRLMFDAGWYAYWEGPLTPICQTYQVRICLIRRKFWDGYFLTNPYECVTVRSPPIGPDPRNTREPPQHVYRLGYPDDFPRLCIHDPAQDEWTPEMSIADVLIPMVIKWLVFHEDWLDTGVWRGGGRHPEPQSTEVPWQQQTSLDPEMRAQRERSLSAAFHKYGRKVGVFGSYPLMVAEFAAHFPQLSWPNLNGATAETAISPNSSTLSLELPREEFLLSGSAQGSLRKTFAISMPNEAERYFPFQNIPSRVA